MIDRTKQETCANHLVQDVVAPSIDLLHPQTDRPYIELLDTVDCQDVVSKVDAVHLIPVNHRSG